MYDYLEELQLTKFIAFDVETTGLNPGADYIIEFSAILFESGKKKSSFSFLCNPGRKITSEIENLTGITNEMLKSEKSFAYYAKDLLELIGDLPVVGHNLAFDMAFLKSELRRAGMNDQFGNTLYDTLLLSRAFYFYLPNHKLGTVAEYCGFSAEGSHRAEVDTYNTGRIFLRLIDEAMLYDAETFQTISKILKNTSTPNKQLFKNLLERAKRDKELLTRKKPKIDWKSLPNISGKNDFEDGWDITEEEIGPLYFANSGKIADILENYEERPQQTKMAEIVYRTIEKGKLSMIEAGTGVGKSLAYLVPAVLQMKKPGREEDKIRVVVATNTKTLQEQIFYKEIPFIQNKLGLSFKAVLLKGRSNYLCLTRWQNLLLELKGRVKADMRVSLIPIVIWLKHTKTGDISENNGFNAQANWWLWKEICSEPGYCTTDQCKKNDGCYLGKIRRQAAVSDMVIVNHSLLFADAAAENSVIPGYTDLIIDEAHNVEKNAYAYFAVSVNYNRISYLLNDLVRPGSAGVGLVKDTENIASRLKQEHNIRTYLNEVTEETEETRKISEEFFLKIAKEKIKTIPENERTYGIKKRYKNFYGEFNGMEKITSEFIEDLSKLKRNIESLTLKMETLAKDLPEVFDKTKTDLKKMVSELSEVNTGLQLLTDANNSELIFWFEMDKKGNEKSVELSCTPLNISEKLYDSIYKHLNSVILTSATLKISNSFDYFKNRIGISFFDRNNVATISVGSPYDYDKQMKFIVYTPTPGGFNSYHSNAEMIIQLSRQVKKGIMVLFTSYSSLKQVYNLVMPEFKKMGVKLLAQGTGTSRTSLLDLFKAEKKSVLFGTDSFWEGVDIRGEALQILIIEKIPFAVPSEPIVEANNEVLQNQNRNSFMEYYLPESILKLRQGVGRLIRTSTDHGVVIFLDNRIDTKQYGGMIKKSLYTNSETIIGLENLLNSVKQFFQNWNKAEKN
ncbi:MAG: DEAD/DEAH box helicase [Candidatus Marinimicrobia bacterium]|nr:DEAD/DEAH box helicase [Candidatus Neomarinimicrobiota bacterium]